MKTAHFVYEVSEFARPLSDLDIYDDPYMAQIFIEHRINYLNEKLAKINNPKVIWDAIYIYKELGFCKPNDIFDKLFTYGVRGNQQIRYHIVDGFMPIFSPITKCIVMHPCKYVDFDFYPLRKEELECKIIPHFEFTVN